MFKLSLFMLYFGQQIQDLKRLINIYPVNKMKANTIFKKISPALLLFAAFSTLFFVQSCKEENPTIPPGTGDNTLEIVFTATANAETFALDSTYVLTTEGFKYKFSLFKFYISQLRLVKEDNSEVVLKDVDMIDFRSDAPNLSVKATIPAGSYKAIKFGIGVDSVNNAKDPASFASSHPLSLSKGTYWDMGSQYRFFLMEGRMDTTMVDSLNVPFVVHTGTNPLYRENSYTVNYVFGQGTNKKATFEIDIDKLLSNINFRTSHVSHTIGGNYTLAENITNNLSANIVLK